MRFAAFSAAQFIRKGLIKDIIKKRLVHKIELDYLDKNVADTINLIKRKPDEIYEYYNEQKRLVNLDENLPIIQKFNQKNDVCVYVGSKQFPIIQKKINKGTLKDANDIILCFLSILDLPFKFNSYIVSTGRDSNGRYVELIADTGAA